MAGRQEMFDKFQPWVLATYGDSAKTKTITKKKARRIVKLLQSKDKVRTRHCTVWFEQSISDNFIFSFETYIYMH